MTDLASHDALAGLTPSPFNLPFVARWADMDFNAHMRNTAYLDVAEECRMQYFAAHGFSMRELERLRVGPVVQRDELSYRRELRLLEPGEVHIALGGLSADGSRFCLVNDVVRVRDGEVVATVRSTGGWLDLDERRLVVPPAGLIEVIALLPRHADCTELPSSLRRVL